MINAPKTLRDLAVQYRNKKKILDKKEQNSNKPEDNSKFQSFLNSFLADVLIFTAMLITLIITLIIIYILYGQSKLKALVIKAVEAADMNGIHYTCKTQWYIMGMLIIITLGMLYLVTNKLRKTSFCKGCLFSNNTKILLLISNTHLYVPIKLCIVAGSTHLFRIRGRLNPKHVKINKNWIWDVFWIDWSDVSITLNDNELHLPSLMIIPFKEKYRARKLLRKHLLLFYIMLKQAKTWFSLVLEPRNLSIGNDNN